MLPNKHGLIKQQLDYDEKQTLWLNSAENVKRGKYVGFDYQNQAPRLMKKIEATRGMPGPILAELENVRAKTFVGLLPKITRVFVTVDEKIFLWNYHSRDDYNEFAVYSGLAQIIVSVALVKPKPGVFVKEIEFILVLATAVEVVMVGIEFEKVNGRRDVQNRIRLHPTQMSVPTDDVHMLKMVGTDDGRILMCGKDGNIYEFLYQAEEGWFTKRCRKYSHTSSTMRSLLPTFIPWSTHDDPLVDLLVGPEMSGGGRRFAYSLSKGGSIRAFIVGQDGQALVPWATYEAKRLQLDIQNKIHENQRNSVTIIKLASVHADESQNVRLMAITKRGDRAYFSLRSHYTSNRIQLEFVRCPPSSYKPSESQQLPKHTKQSPSNVTQALYRDGAFLLADCHENGDHLVALLGNTSARIGGFETVDKLELENEIVTDIAEVDLELYMYKNPISSILHLTGRAKPVVGLSELTVQHALPNRQFLVLSGSGLSTYMKRRPLDELIDLLRERHNTRINMFFQRYTHKESCAMCLVVACYPIAYRLMLHDEAKFNADSSFALPDRYTNETDVFRHNPELKILATELFFEFGSYPATQTHTVKQEPETAKLAGLALYMSRLLRPVWTWTICYQQGNDSSNLRLRFNKSQLIALRDCLLPLKTFVEKNSNRFQVMVIDRQPSEEMKQRETQENNYFEQLRSTIAGSLESFELLIALAGEDINFLKIVAKLKREYINKLQTEKFGDFVNGGRELAQELVNALMHVKQMPQKTGQVSDDKKWVVDLQRSCPEFVGESQVCLYQGNDHINRLIKQARVAARRGGLLPETAKRKEMREALLQYKTAARNSNFDIESVCERLRSVHGFVAVVELCLHRSQLLGSGEVRNPGGVSASNHTSQELDAWVWQQREQCYGCILKTFGILMDWPRGQDGLSDFQMDQDQKRFVERLMVQRCLSSSDQNFHNRLYDWFQKNRKDLLFSIKSPFLLPYLTSRDDPEHMGLLKEYYIKNNMNRSAAILLKELAIRDTKDYDLEQRHDFLIRALGCAKRCVDTDTISQQMDPYEINQIRERLELCKIQTTICHALNQIQDKVDDEEKARLQHKLFDIDELYNDFAKKHQLWEACLAIFRFEGAQRERRTFIEKTWTNIIRSEILHDEQFNKGAGGGEGDGEGFHNALVVQTSQWRARLSKNIRKLYQTYHDDHFMFPMEHIIRELEVSNSTYAMGGSFTWVVDCLLQATVPLLDVLKAYESLIDHSMAQPEFTQQMKQRIAQSVIHLQQYVKSELGEQQLCRSDQLAIREQARNLRSACLRELRSADLQDEPEGRQLQGEFF